MSKTAIFIDAAYLLLAGGRYAIDPAVRRADVDCDYAAFINDLVDDVLAKFCPSGTRLLRCYWYDAAPSGRLNEQHDQIAAIERVKLRMGSLVGGRQKGVEARLVFDLMSLAAEGGITEAILITDDEDVLAPLVWAQRHGVRVGVATAPLTPGGRLPKTLIAESDQHIALEPQLMEDSFSPSATWNEAVEIDLTRQIGERFATDWLSRAAPRDLEELARLHPRIPPAVDSQMLSKVEWDLTQAERRRLRDAFWAIVGRSIDLD